MSVSRTWSCQLKSNSWKRSTTILEMMLSVCPLDLKANTKTKHYKSKDWWWLLLPIRHRIERHLLPRGNSGNKWRFKLISTSNQSHRLVLSMTNWSRTSRLCKSTRDRGSSVRLCPSADLKHLIRSMALRLNLLNSYNKPYSKAWRQNLISRI